ncbi:hypothetical protein BC830DRAFT_1175187 [Chytriomyces sp. MP71]|nr:hypothetical protein BC830DRAFT_1175187 [Chytriomyces sp. MP71]
MFAMGYFAESGMTEKGVGSPNEKAALQWYKKAAVAGESKAVKRLEELGVAIDWKAFKKLEKMEQNALQVGGGVAPVGDVAKRVQKGVADGIGEIKNKFVGRHSEVDEELDGGHKCAIM